MEALHTREVKNTHALLANHLNYIRKINLLESATAVLSFEYALNATEPLFPCMHTIREYGPNGTQIIVFDEVEDTWVKFNSTFRAARVLSEQHGVKFYSSDVLRFVVSYRFAGRTWRLNRSSARRLSNHITHAAWSLDLTPLV